VACNAMSSGGTPGCDTASEQWIAEVVDSARRLRAYPGDLQKRMHQTNEKTLSNTTYQLTFHFLLPCIHRSRGKCLGCSG
jgi:hypothetical protein